MVVDRGSYTRAASDLDVSRSTLSEHISSLEAQLSRTLLTRGQRGVSVTEAGRTLYRHAQLIVRQMEQAEQDVRLVSKVASGHVSLGLAT
ncbi:MAG: LysR family transcriptional regulator, partial [Nevskiales bacterium]